MRRARAVALAALVGLVAAGDGRAASPAPAEIGRAACPVTEPNGIHVAGESSERAHGNAALATVLPAGPVTFLEKQPGCRMPDGSLAMKWPWWRRASGPLTIEGTRLDKDAPPLGARVAHGYGDTGFQATALFFPTPGCWRVIGHVAGRSLTFVTSVEAVGEGPPACSEGRWPPGRDNRDWQDHAQEAASVGGGGQIRTAE